MTRDPVRLRLAAAAVHLYTACGAALAFLIVLAAFDGESVRALWLGLIAMIVDGTDGSSRDGCRVKERLPWFDGARLDDIVDYLTYAFAPMLLLWSNRLPALGTLGTARGRSSPCSRRATSSAGPTPRPTTTSSSAFRATGTSWRSTRSCCDADPPSTRRRARRLLRPRLRADPVPVPVADPFGLPRVSLLLTGGWLVCWAVILVQMPHPHPAVVVTSLAYVVYYLGLSLWLTVRARTARRPPEATSAAPSEPVLG